MSAWPRRGDGVHDRLTDFSRPVSGAYYFAPSLTVLNELADAPAPARIDTRADALR